MKYQLYRLFLRLLTGLVYLKRGAFWVGARMFAGLRVVNGWYKRSIGFYVYKAGYSIGKKLEKHNITVKGRLTDIFTRRAALQIGLLAAFFVMILPHSQILAEDRPGIAGRQTILYAMVGPGEQDFNDAIIVDARSVVIPAGTSQRNEGAIGSDGTVDRDSALPQEPQDLAGISAGGTALIKPTILPGNEQTVPAVSSADTVDDDRNEVIEYTVRAGDTPGGIAERFGIDLDTLYASNNMRRSDYIQPGQALTILPVSGVVHTVKSGDTVNKIARTYNAEVSEIIAFNNLRNDGADIIIGEELVVPGGKKAAPLLNTRAVVRTIPNIVPQLSQKPSPQTPAGSGYIWPSSVRYISQYFHWRHGAVDIAGPAGSPLYAVRGGTVITAANSRPCRWNYGFGCYVVIDHGGGIQTLYAHAIAGSLTVNVGDRVNQGQVIGLMGSTGNSSGPHVHFEIRINGVRQNPLSYIR